MKNASQSSNASSDASEFAKKKSGAPWWMWLLCGLLLLLMAAYGGGRALLSHRLANIYGRMDPAEKAVIQAFLYDAQEVPLAWRDARPASPKLAEKANDFIAAADTFHSPKDASGKRVSPSSALDACVAGQPIAEADRERVELLVAAAEPGIQAAMELAALPDYDLNLVRDTRQGFDIPMESRPSFIAVRETARAMGAKAHLHADRGEWEQSLETAVALARLAHRHPGSWLVTHMIGVALEGIAVDALLDIAKRCDDPAILERAAKELAPLGKLLRENFDTEKISLQEPVGMLIDYKRAGYPVDLSPKAPPIHFYREWIKAHEEYPAWRLAQLKPSAPEAERLVSHQSRTNDFAEFDNDMIFGCKALDKLGARREADQFLALVAATGGDRAKVAARVRVAQYELVLLALASRAVQLRAGADEPSPLAPEQMAEFFPAGAPEDVFAPGSPHKWSVAKKTYYSVGPDGKDDAAAVEANKANKFAAGDLFWE